MMIINSNNKDLLLKGMKNRGFNQDPKDLREKIYNQLHASKTTDEQKPKKIEETQDDALKIKRAYDNLNRLNKKL